METKNIFIIIAIAAVAVTGVVIFSKGNNDASPATNSQVSDNIRIADGKQIITINAKGGYYPRVTNAKANMPTIINLKTENTFDCSSSVYIPSLGYRNTLPASGQTSVDVPAQQAGTSMKGLCSMGMYNFTVNFN